MSFRLHPGSALGRQTQQVARSQLKKAARDLEDRDSDSDEAIHAARKRFKKVRGLYRLVRSGDPSFQKRENARIRDIAATLSGVRDATALIEAVDGLAAHLPSGTVPEELSLARSELVARRHRLVNERKEGAERMAAAAEACRAAMAALDDLDIPGGSKEASAVVAAGWRRTCKRAAKALSACQTEGGDDDFHTLRKRVKDHAMQTRLLADLWPVPMVLRRRVADSLAKTIGSEHDLAVLTDLIRDDPDAVGGASARQLLERLIADRRAELRAHALDRAGLLFAEPAKREARRVALLWREADS